MLAIKILRPMDRLVIPTQAHSAIIVVEPPYVSGLALRDHARFALLVHTQSLKLKTQ